jgi:hypothetical protein
MYVPSGTPERDTTDETDGYCATGGKLLVLAR